MVIVAVGVVTSRAVEAQIVFEFKRIECHHHAIVVLMQDITERCRVCSHRMERMNPGRSCGGGCVCGIWHAQIRRDDRRRDGRTVIRDRASLAGCRVVIVIPLIILLRVTLNVLLGLLVELVMLLLLRVEWLLRTISLVQSTLIIRLRDMQEIAMGVTTTSGTKLELAWNPRRQRAKSGRRRMVMMPQRASRERR